MKELIKNALKVAFDKLGKNPTTKIDVKKFDISGVSPIDLSAFMRKNNIPNDAYFSNDSDYLCYDITVQMSEKEKTDFYRRRFSNIAFKYVYESLTNNGFKRVGFNSALLKPFEKTTVYDMYVNKDFDMLVKYYSLYFVKI